MCRPRIPAARSEVLHKAGRKTAGLRELLAQFLRGAQWEELGRRRSQNLPSRSFTAFAAASRSKGFFLRGHLVAAKPAVCRKGVKIPIRRWNRVLTPFTNSESGAASLTRTRWPT